MTALEIEPLAAAAFAPFGEVIEIAGAEAREINQGTTTRFHDLCRIDVSASGGRALLSLFRADGRPSPIVIELLERHPLGSQAFFPVSNADWLVVVATGAADDASRPDLAALRCFRARGDQGVNYARGVWHHPVLVLAPRQDFLVVDRGGPDGEDASANLDEVWFSDQPRTIQI